MIAAPAMTELAARVRDQLLWLCPILSVGVAALLFWTFGLTWWSAILAAAVLGCPLAVGWALLAERRQGHKLERSSRS